MNRTPSAPSRWGAVTAVALVVTLATLDMTAVAFALPAIGTAFDAPPDLLQWVVLAYALPLVALLLPAGRWVDTVPHRKAFLVATLGFASASVLAGVATSFPFLIASRAIQGAFAAVATVLVPAVATAAVRPEERGRAMGLIGTLGPLGSFTGPAAGGLVLATLGWRWIFLLVVPVAIIAAALGARTIRGSTRPLSWPRPAWAGEALTIGGGVLALFAALHVLGNGAARVDARVIALGAAAVLGVVAWTRLPGTRPVTRLTRRRGITLPVIALTLLSTVGGSLYYTTPFFLERVLDVDVRAAGLAIVALPLAMAVTAPVGGWLADRFGPRPLMATGSALAVAGLALLAPLDVAWHPRDLAWRLVVTGVGIGLFAGPNQSALMGAAPADLRGTVGALSGLGRQFGFALGPAVVTFAWTVSGSDIATGLRAGLTATLALAVLGAAAAALASAPAATPAPEAVKETAAGRRA